MAKPSWDEMRRTVRDVSAKNKPYYWYENQFRTDLRSDERDLRSRAGSGFFSVIAKRFAHSIIIALLIVLLSACASQHSNTLKQVDNANASRLQDRYGTQIKLENAIAAAELDPVQRNILLNDLILIVDLNYYEWERRLYNKKASFDLGTDATLLGLGGATALAGTTSLANVLGQISTGVTGLKSSVDTDVLQKNSIPALVSKMRAARATQLAKMQAAMIKTDANGEPTGATSTSKYSIHQGLIDLNLYYAAGTFVGALQDIVEKAADEKKSADKTINKLKPNADLINKTPDLPGD